jgi:hypothetical protein
MQVRRPGTGTYTPLTTKRTFLKVARLIMLMECISLRVFSVMNLVILNYSDLSCLLDS